MINMFCAKVSICPKCIALPCYLTSLLNTSFDQFFFPHERMNEFTKCRDSWQGLYPWLPYLEDAKMRNEKMKSFIKDCLIKTRLANGKPTTTITDHDYRSN